MTKKKLNDGAKVHDVIAKLKALEKALRQRVTKLERQGCENLNLHIKSGTNKMFHRGGSPDPKTGQRDYRYIGTDPKKQQDALDRVKRYKEREQLLWNLRKLAQQIERLEEAISEMADDAKDMLDEWRGTQLELLG